MKIHLLLTRAGRRGPTILGIVFAGASLFAPRFAHAQTDGQPYAEPSAGQRYQAAPAYPQQQPGQQPAQQPYPQQQTYEQQPQPAQPQDVHVPIFFAAAGGAWVPWPGTFAENHKIGGAVDVMAGFSLEPFIHQPIDLFVDVMGSQHGLEERAWADADHTTTTVVVGCVGARWFLIEPLNIGAPYLLAAGGLVYEDAEPTLTHAPPQPSWISMGGVGWEAPIGQVLRLGARVVATYLDENGGLLGWVAPSVTLGGQL